MRYRWVGIILTSLCLAMVAGCGQRQPRAGGTVRRPGEPDIIYIAEDDPKMTAATRQARASVSRFITALGRPTSTQTGFSIKVPIREDARVEQRWVNELSYRNGRFSGRLNHEPEHVKTVKNGDPVTVAPGEISDWLYLEKGNLRGGYTVRVLRDTLPSQQPPFSID
jgi:uncharacterized protein YegJ (DUF2314 family)